MEQKTGRLAEVVQQATGVVPAGCDSAFLLGLGVDDDFVVSCAAPETLVVVHGTWFIGFIWFHLRFTEVLYHQY